MGIRIGLTGGIGSGKSTAAKALATLGALVVNADDIAKEILEPGHAVYQQVKDEFGPKILENPADKDSPINRKALAAEVFESVEKRRLLNSITHPAIAAIADECLSAAGPNQVAVYEIPLLTEVGAADQFDEVLVIETPVDERIKRLIKRGMSEREAESRIKAQATDEERAQVATKIIRNTGTEKDLETEIATWWRTLTKK